MVHLKFILASVASSLMILASDCDDFICAIRPIEKLRLQDQSASKKLQLASVPSSCPTKKTIYPTRCGNCPLFLMNLRPSLSQFLVETTGASSSSKTYSQLRKDAEKKAQLKNAQNRTKSRRERELEAREEGLSKSLLERAKEEEDGSGSKGLSIMMKMGFLPGRSLGRPLDDGSNNNNNASKSEISSPKDLVAPSNIENRPRIGNPHRTEPLPISEWTGMHAYRYLFPRTGTHFGYRQGRHRNF